MTLSSADPGGSRRRSQPHSRNRAGYDLDKLKIVGIITGPKRSKVMIKIPSGKMFIVEELTHIGTRHGLIKKILPGMIEVEEKVVNLLGQEESVQTVMEYNGLGKEKEKEIEAKKEGI